MHNRKEVLDPALTRPGRVDFECELGHCTRTMAKQFFLNFYPSQEVCLQQSGLGLGLGLGIGIGLGLDTPARRHACSVSAMPVGTLATREFVGMRVMLQL